MISEFFSIVEEWGDVALWFLCGTLNWEVWIWVFVGSMYFDHGKVTLLSQCLSLLRKRNGSLLTVRETWPYPRDNPSMDQHSIQEGNNTPTSWMLWKSGQVCAKLATLQSISQKIINFALLWLFLLKHKLWHHLSQKACTCNVRKNVPSSEVSASYWQKFFRGKSIFVYNNKLLAQLPLLQLPLILLLLMTKCNRYCF